MFVEDEVAEEGPELRVNQLCRQEKEGPFSQLESYVRGVKWPPDTDKLYVQWTFSFDVSSEQLV